MKTDPGWIQCKKWTYVICTALISVISLQTAVIYSYSCVSGDWG